jgi:hypothetical protein
MILSTHFIAGAAVASQTDNPTALIALPLITHLVLDVIPHWQYLYEIKELKKNIPQLILDIVIGPIIVGVLSLWLNGFDWTKLIWLLTGGVIAVFPDGITFLSILFPKNKIAKKITDFHEWIQGERRFEGVLGFIATLLIDLAAILVIVLPKV